ncbi:MAG TPA: PAS domain S-box protein [Smithella sp.]|nr:PAS domain S-box protein [Smithella sp.]
MKDQLLRVLMVEDSEDDALFILRELKRGGYVPAFERVESASAMKVALRDKPWDIILCDYQMPSFNGAAAIGLLKGLNIDIPLIIVTGAIGEETAAESMRLGAQDYIMKGNLSRLCPAIARELEDAKVRINKKRAEAQLKENENKYRLLADNIHDVVFIMDMNLNYTYLSPSVKLLRGYEPEEAMKHTPAETVTPSSLEKAMGILLEIIEEEKSERKDLNKVRSAQLEMIRKDGTTVWVETTASILRDENQQAIGIMGVTRDITKRKKAEDLLLESEEKFRVLADTTPVAIGLFQNDRWIYANRAAQMMSGYSAEEIYKMNFWDIVHPDYKSLTQARGQKRQQGEDVVHRYEFKIITKDGVEKWVDFSGASTILMGKPVAIINVIDITERKLAEEKLKESERQYRLLAEKMSDVVWIVDMNLKMVYVSPSVEKLLGFSQEERMLQPMEEQLTPQSMSMVLETLSRELSLEEQKNTDPNRTLKMDLEYYHKDGSTRLMESVMSGIRDDRGILTGIHGLSRDISERKKAEDNLRASEESYRQLFENSPAGIYRVDYKTQKVIKANDVFCKYVDCTPEEISALNPYDILSEDSRKLFSERVGKILRGEPVPDTAEFEIINKNGRRFHMQLHIKNVYDAQGHVIAADVVAHDITERKKAEEKLQHTLESLRKAVGTTIQVLVSAVESRDAYTSGHQAKSADMACAIAAEMGLSEDKIEGLRMAGLIHDIGKLSIPAEILSKPTKLTEIEFSLIKEHSRSGYEMLKDVESPWPLAEIVYQHHERMDGSGYPRKLKGDEILMEARILAVADVVEAIASHRPYRAAMGIEAALEEIEKYKGVLYDNAVVDACLKLFKEKGYRH